jgi:hypothetical protein
MYGERILVESSELEGFSVTPATVAATYTDPVNLERCRRFIAELCVPTLSGGAVVNFALYGAITSGGTYTLITGTSITAESAGNKVFQIEITTDAVTQFNSAYQWLKGYTKVTTASAGNVSALIRGFYPKYLPGADQAAAAQPPIYAPGD